MSSARKLILQRLRNNRVTANRITPSPYTTKDLSIEQRIARYTELQETVHGEVHRVAKDQWLNWLTQELPKRGVHRLLAGTNEIGRQLAAAVVPGVETILYERDIDEWKSDLFNSVDAAVTGSHGGIAESGSLILWPDEQEPRTMSLVPPMHIALLDSAKLYQSFVEAIESENWHEGMPTNAILISGPSKTADIEQTLAYGIHGPKQLITLILDY